MASRDKDSYSIQSVENALDVLEALCEEDEEVRISRLSERLQMNKTSIFRLLATFESRGYVERKEDSGKYRLGLSAYEIGQKLISRMGLLKQAHPVMEKLVRDCEEAIYVAVRRDDEFLLIDMVDTTQQVKIVPLVGKRYPLTSSAPGQLLQATATISATDHPEQVVGPLTERAGLDDHTLETGGLGDGITCLAVPLYTADGSLCACLCMIGPDFRMSSDKIESALLPKLKEASDTISSKLGYHNPYLSRRI